MLQAPHCAHGCGQPLMSENTAVVPWAHPHAQMPPACAHDGGEPAAPPVAFEPAVPPDAVVPAAPPVAPFEVVSVSEEQPTQSTMNVAKMVWLGPLFIVTKSPKLQV
jgi:hypothetical protein